MFRSLRARVIATCVLSVLLAQTITSVVIGQQARDAAEQRVGALLVEQCRFLINSLDKSMWNWSNQVEVLSNAITITGSTTPKVASAMLHALRDAVPEFSWIGLINAEGTVLAATDDILLGKSIAKRPVFLEGMKGNFVGDVHDAVLLANLLPNPTGEHMKFVDVSSPVHDHKGSVTGVLAAHLSWGWVREVEKNMLQKAAVGKGVELFVVAADGTVLQGTPALLGKPLELPLLAGGVPVTRSFWITNSDRDYWLKRTHIQSVSGFWHLRVAEGDRLSERSEGRKLPQQEMRALAVLGN